MNTKGLPGHNKICFHYIRRDVFACVFLGMITLAIYWQARNYDFINFDDPVYVIENLNVRNGLTLQGLIWAFQANVSANWHPLTLLSHMADCHFFELNAGYHHLTNVLLHILNTFLLFFLFFNMTNRFWLSVFIAGIFALHPLHV